MFSSVLTDETVEDIIQSGFTNIFPDMSENGLGQFSQSVSDNKSDTVTLLRRSTRKVERLKCSDTDSNANEEDDDGDDNSDDKNGSDRDKVEPKDKDRNSNYVGSKGRNDEDKNLTNSNDQTKSKRGSSKLKTLVSVKKERIFKNTKRRVKCPLCDLELATKSILKRHCLRRHPDEWFEFKCADCPSMFKTRKLIIKLPLLLLCLLLPCILIMFSLY